MNLDLTPFGATAEKRVANAVSAFTNGSPVLVLDDADRENEGDLILAADKLTTSQMAQLIRDCSGIVCLVLEAERAKALALPPMVEHNTSQNGTAFTVSIEAKQGVTTGVSAADRVTTIKAAIADGATPKDLARPGHVFPLIAAEGGVLERRGHTEAGIDLCKLANTKPAAVLCELVNPDGSMSKGQTLVEYAIKHAIPMLTIEDLVSALEASAAA